MAEFTRGAHSLHLNGYQYILNKKGRNENTYWRYVDRSCGGRATLDDDDDDVVSENNNYTHPPNPQQVCIVVDKLEEKLFHSLRLCRRSRETP